MQFIFCKCINVIEDSQGSTSLNCVQTQFAFTLLNLSGQFPQHSPVTPTDNFPQTIIVPTGQLPPHTTTPQLGLGCSGTILDSLFKQCNVSKLMLPIPQIADKL